MAKMLVFENSGKMWMQKTNRKKREEKKMTAKILSSCSLKCADVIFDAILSLEPAQSHTPYTHCALWWDIIKHAYVQVCFQYYYNKYKKWFRLFTEIQCANWFNADVKRRCFFFLFFRFCCSSTSSSSASVFFSNVLTLVQTCVRHDSIDKDLSFYFVPFNNRFLH